MRSIMATAGNGGDPTRSTFRHTCNDRHLDTGILSALSHLH